MSNTVLVDMNGVLAKFDDKVIEVIAEEHPDIPIPESRHNFYISDDFLPQHRDIVRSISDRLGFFASLAVEESAVEAWSAMVEAGYHPQICSAPLYSHPNSVNEKRDWLEEHFVPHFGYSVLERAIIQRDKTIHSGIALIDDKPLITGSQKPVWRHVIFDKPYNQLSSGYRLRGWNTATLLSILDSIQN